MRPFAIHRLGLTAGVLALASTLAACEPPPSQEPEIIQPPVETPVAPETETPPVEPTPSPDSSAPPADDPTSEDSVRPESETLFY